VLGILINQVLGMNLGLSLSNSIVMVGRHGGGWMEEGCNSMNRRCDDEKINAAP
jgi:hypothetical protein